ncbi:MAG: molybdopterin oxidoreductase, partial [Aquificota bacterium]
PFEGWQKRKEDYEVGRLLLRARASNNTPPGCAKIWFNMYGSSHGTVRGTRVRRDGMAKNPDTNYQSLYRCGSHQSVTRGWFKPTYQTDTLIRKNLMGQIIGKGFELDVHGLIGAPREGFCRISKAEDGGIGGKGMWRPVKLGFRPTTASEALKKYLQGKFV